MRSDTILTVTCGLIVTAATLFAADPVSAPPGIRTFSELPRSFSALQKAHEEAVKKNGACDYLLEKQPLELSGFQPALTKRDENENKNLKALPNPSTRRQIFSVGVEVAPEDVPRLPKLSSSQILDYLKSHYVSLQAKIQKDPGKNTLYLHHRVIAATVPYGDTRTREFQPAVAGSIREIHSLGVYLPAKLPPTPENLRTVVLIHKHVAAEKNPVRPGADRLEPRYEYIFVRAKASLAGNKLDLHVFASSDERRKLHYLRSGGSPKNPDDCTVNAEIFFTRFNTAGLIPEEAAMRRQKVKARTSYDFTALDAFTKRNIALKGDALDNLNETLDAIIDGKITPSALPATKPTTPAASK